MDRRLANEISKYNIIHETKYISHISNINYETLNTNEIMNIKYNILLFPIDINIIVKIVYNNMYPFHSPKIYVNKCKYANLLKINIRKVFQEIYGKEYCLCCTSILCRENWGPTLDTKHIINEIVENILIKSRIVNILHLQKICQKNNIFNDLYREIKKYL